MRPSRLSFTICVPSHRPNNSSWPGGVPVMTLTAMPWPKWRRVKENPGGAAVLSAEMDSSCCIMRAL